MFEKIDRKDNRRTDELSKVIVGEQIQGIWLEPLPNKSIEAEIFPAEIESNWMTSLKQYIANGLLLDNPDVARKVRTIVAWYLMIHTLYRAMGNWPLLKYVSKVNVLTFSKRFMTVYVVLTLGLMH